MEVNGYRQTGRKKNQTDEIERSEIFDGDYPFEGLTGNGFAVG